MKAITIDDDNYGLVKLVRNTLGVTEAQAANVLMEIGLVNILAYPDCTPKAKEVLSRAEYADLVIKIKSTWKY